MSIKETQEVRNEEKIISRLRFLADAWEDGDTVQYRGRSGQWYDLSPDNINFDYTITNKSSELRIKPKPYVSYQNEYRREDGSLWLSHYGYATRSEAIEANKRNSQYVRTIKMVEES